MKRTGHVEDGGDKIGSDVDCRHRGNAVVA